MFRRVSNFKRGIVTGTGLGRARHSAINAKGEWSVRATPAV
jgi:hypothetical protein